MLQLALHGGAPVRTKPFASWPIYDEREAQALQSVLASRNWGGYPYPNDHAREFAQKFADYHGAKYGVTVANGTISLELALKAIGVRVNVYKNRHSAAKQNRSRRAFPRVSRNNH